MIWADCEQISSLSSPSSWMSGSLEGRDDDAFRCVDQKRDLYTTSNRGIVLNWPGKWYHQEQLKLLSMILTESIYPFVFHASTEQTENSFFLWCYLQPSRWTSLIFYFLKEQRRIKAGNNGSVGSVYDNNVSLSIYIYKDTKRHREKIHSFVMHFYSLHVSIFFFLVWFNLIVLLCKDKSKIKKRWESEEKKIFIPVSIHSHSSAGLSYKTVCCK